MRPPLFVVFVIALFLVMSLITVAYAEDAAYVPGELLVGLKEGVTQDALQALNARVGAEMIYQFKLINAYQLRLPKRLTVPAAIAFYSRQAEVEYAEPNYLAYIDAIPNDPKFNEMWGMNNTGQTGGTPDADIDAPEAWEIATGSEAIVVASIDSGVDYNHEDLAANMWKNPGEIPDNGKDDDGNGFVDDVYGYDFYNNDNAPMDDNGHGTHTSGTIGAVGNNGIGVAGVCWKVKIMALKCFSASGMSDNAAIIKCVQYATLMGARLSNNSYGGPPSQSLRDAIAAGPLFVAAAGNGGRDDIGDDNDIISHYPASYRLRNIIAVAATDDKDMKASFSNYGIKSVDLGAPGVNILSTTPQNTYSLGDGTSMAAPHVAGVAALVMAVNPNLSDLEVKDGILNSVDNVPGLVGKVLTGGRLNAATAVKLALPAAPPIAMAKRTALTKVNPTLRVSSLGNAFPSPANPEVWLPYRLEAASDVTLTIYNLAGQVVRTLDLGHRLAGIYENKQLSVHWDGRNANGETVASGFYFYTLKAGDFTATRKLLIVR